MKEARALGRMLSTLYSDAFVTIEVDTLAGVVTYRRTREPYPSMDVLVRSFDAVVLALATPGLRGMRILIDVRAAPGRNDREFEAVLRTYRSQLFLPFSKRAILVQTVFGLMQTTRLEREEGHAAAPCFYDESTALAYLRAG